MGENTGLYSEVAKALWIRGTNKKCSPGGLTYVGGLCVWGGGVKLEERVCIQAKADKSVGIISKKGLTVLNRQGLCLKISCSKK